MWPHGTEPSRAPLTYTAPSIWNARPFRLPGSFLIVTSISADMLPPQEGPPWLPRLHQCLLITPVLPGLCPRRMYKSGSSLEWLFVPQTNLKPHAGSTLSETCKPLYPQHLTQCLTPKSWKNVIKTDRIYYFHSLLLHASPHRLPRRVKTKVHESQYKIHTDFSSYHHHQLTVTKLLQLTG